MSVQALGNLVWSINARLYNATYSNLVHEIDTKILDFLHSRGNITGKKVLDVGAGTGIMTLKCVGIGAEEVHAVDRNFTMLSKLSDNPIYQQNLGRIHLYGADMEDRGIERLAQNADLSFDAIFFKRCLYFSPEGVKSVLQQAENVLNPGGHIVIVHPEKSMVEYCKNEEGGFAPTHMLRRASSWIGRTCGMEYNLYTAKELDTLCHEALPTMAKISLTPSRPAYNVRLLEKSRIIS